MKESTPVAVDHQFRARRRRMPNGITFVGPAFIAAVAYVDPGNLATNVTAGATFGHSLLWVIVVANLVAMLVQYLSAKLGIATGMNLPEVCRAKFSRPIRLGMWIQAELVVVMTDLAEVVGGAIALQLLFGLPLPAGGVLTAAGMLVILMLQQRGRRHFEAVIGALLAVVFAAFAYQMFRAGIDGPATMRGLVPSFPPNSMLLAVGIVGATVMPHAIYLHSALTQDLCQRIDPISRRTALRITRMDVLVALALAGVVNAAILLAATPLKGSNAGSLQDAHAAFGVTLGNTTAAVFGVALLASGLASSCVGVYSGQVVMQGFVNRSIPIWVRRLVSLAPALVVLTIGVDPTQALVLSQVVLSFGVPFALFPLLRFTGDKQLMAELANRRSTVIAGWLAGGLIVVLNGYLIWSVFSR